MMFSGDIHNIAAVKCRTTNTNIRWGIITFPEHLLNASRHRSGAAELSIPLKSVSSIILPI